MRWRGLRPSKKPTVSWRTRARRATTRRAKYCPRSQTSAETDFEDWTLSLRIGGGRPSARARLCPGAVITRNARHPRPPSFQLRRGSAHQYFLATLPLLDRDWRLPALDRLYAICMCERRSHVRLQLRSEVICGDRLRDGYVGRRRKARQWPVSNYCPAGRLIGDDSWIVEPRRLEELVHPEEKTCPGGTVDQKMDCQRTR
jgi:hypothetical protein